MSIASVIDFIHLCNTFETIVKLKTPQQRFNGLKKLFNDYRQKIDSIKNKNPNVDCSLFPILRLILPTLERERGPYGLKNKTLTDVYLRVYCIGRKTKEAQMLLNYREPTNNADSGSNFAETVYFVLKNRLPGRASSFTIEQINFLLDSVAKTYESNQSRHDIFKNYLLELNAIELKWITKIILKDLKLGISQKKIFEAFHPDAEKMFNVQSNLKEICEKLLDPNIRIYNDNEIKIEIFSHFKPMLLERCKIENIAKFFQEDEKRCFVQAKHDGERSQIHMKNGRFKYFTRQGYEIATKPSYGETKSSGGFLTSNISHLLNKNCHSIILDGELMGYHKQKKKFGSKGMNYDVKNLKDTSAHQPCFIAFDIILYNDELLINKPYYERLNILENAFTEKEGIFMRSKTTTISSSKELVQLFNQSLDNDDEGIVVKKYDSFYKPNVRENSGCYKLKAEYSENLIHDIDAIILGGYYGEGKWSGLCNSFLVGIADAPIKKGGMPMTFQAVVAVSSGFKHDVLKELNEKFKKFWKKRIPSNVIGPRNELPNVWVDPKESIIVQLRATEIIRSKDYPFGYTLRFPRVVEVRNDKPWHGASTTTEFLSLIKTSDMIQKLTKRHATDEDVNTFVTKVPKISTTRLRNSRVDQSMLGISSHTITRLTRLFNGKEFCVLNGNSELSKHDIERILYQHMATIVQNPRKSTFCVITGDPKPWKVKNAIESQKYNIVTLDWLKRVTRKENWRKLQDFYPWELLSTNPTTKKRLSMLYDNYYDNYTVNATAESLEISFKKAEEFIEEDKVQVNLKELDEELFENGISPFSIFRGMVAYFHESIRFEKSIFQFLSGTLAENPNDASYVIINENLVNNNISILNNSAKILNSKWINDCFTNKTLLPLEDYIFKTR